MAATPLSVVRAQVLTGGHLGKSKVILSIETTIDDIDFIAIKGRDLARAVGYDSGGSESRKTYSVPQRLVAHLKKLRDDKVDEIIHAHIRSRDPCADAEVVPTIKDRTNAFAAAEVPDVLRVDVPQVKLRDRTIPQTNFHVLSSNKKSSCVSMECNMEFIQWLHEASQASCWGEGDCDEGTDENAAVEALVKHSLPEGVTFKVAEGDRVILKAWSTKRSADNTSYVP